MYWLINRRLLELLNIGVSKVREYGQVVKMTPDFSPMAAPGKTQMIYAEMRADESMSLLTIYLSEYQTVRKVDISIFIFI